MQLPRQLGSLGGLLVAGEPFKAGPFLPAAVTTTMMDLLINMKDAGITDDGQLKGLRRSAQQQVADSGFITCLQHLLEATTEQLERCTSAAAAAAAPGDESSSSRIAAAAAASLPSSTPAAGSNVAASSLGVLQCTAGKLLEVHIRLYTLFSCGAQLEAAKDMFDRMGSTDAAATHLMTAGVRHISALLPTVTLKPQQQQQQQEGEGEELSVGLVSLAKGVADGMLGHANLIRGFREQQPQILVGRGPHFVVWSHMSLLLSSYSCVLQQQQQQPAVQGAQGHPKQPPHSGRAAAAAASRRGASSSSSSSANANSSGRSRQQQRCGQSGLTQEGLLDDLTTGLAAWQEAQARWEQLPASHSQLLQLLGVSPQAALWLAALMLRRDLPVPTAGDCWAFNPLNPAVPTATDDEAQEQMQQWDKQPVRELLQLLLLLYDAAHAAAGDDEFVCCCVEVLAPLLGLLQQQFIAAAMPLMQQMGEECFGNEYTPAFTPQMQYEALLLTVRLLQRLQQLRETGGGGSSSNARLTRAATYAMQRTFENAAARAQCVAHAEDLGVEAILLLATGIQGARLMSC
jgi:hypothetical protein